MLGGFLNSGRMLTLSKQARQKYLKIMVPDRDKGCFVMDIQKYGDNTAEQRFLCSAVSVLDIGYFYFNSFDLSNFCPVHL